MGRIKIVSLLLIVFMTFLMPEVVFEALHALFELLMEFGHTLFEILEVSLDMLVEHAFHTDLHQTQVIVFYILLFFVLFWLRRLWRAWPGYCQRLKEWVTGYKERTRTRLNDFWQSFTLVKKIEILLAVVSISLIYILFFI